MRTSPIQLLDSTLLRVNVEHSTDNGFQLDDHNPANWERVSVRTSRLFTEAEGYWQDRPVPVPNIESRTFAIQLGIKSDRLDNEKEWCPYAFEVVMGVVVAVVRDDEPETVRRMAFQYGLQFAFGSVRDLLLTMTSRMQYGPMLLPTMSFMDEVPSKEKEPAQVPSS